MMKQKSGDDRGEADLVPLWTAKEAAGFLGMAESRFRFFAFGRRIPYYRIGGYFKGGVVRFHPDDIQCWKQMRAAGKEVKRVPLLARKKYRGEKVRERMRKGKEWKSRVPKAVHEKIGLRKIRKNSR